MTIIRRRSASERMAARKSERKYNRKRAMRGGRRLTSGPLSMAHKSAVKRLKMKGFYKKIAKLHNSIDLPDYTNGLVEAHPSVLALIFEEAALFDSPEEFAKAYAAKPPEYLGTKAGVTALAFEAYIAEHRELVEHFVETVVSPNEKGFTAIFDGEMDARCWALLERCDFIDATALIEYGDHSFETAMSSDLTILECSPTGALPEEDEPTGNMVPLAQVKAEGGLTTEAAEFLYGTDFLTSAIQEDGSEWEQVEGKWVPVLEAEDMELLPVSEADTMQIANTIRSQIGSKALFMLGAKNLGGGNLSSRTKEGREFSGLSFKVGANPKGVTHVQVLLQPSDTYLVEFLKIRGTNLKVTSSQDDVYAEDLCSALETGTGNLTSLGTMGKQTEAAAIEPQIEMTRSSTVGGFQPCNLGPVKKFQEMLKKKNKKPVV